MKLSIYRFCPNDIVRKLNLLFEILQACYLKYFRSSCNQQSIMDNYEFYWKFLKEAVATCLNVATTSNIRMEHI